MSKTNISMLLYGSAGSGKSIFASTFPKPLIFDFDNGHKIYESQNLFPKARYVRGEGSKMLSLLSKAVNQITEGTFKYETLVIDSLTNLENNAISRFKGLTKDNLSSHMYTSRGKKLGYDEWGNISGSTIALLTMLREYPVNLVVITQLASKFDNGTELYMPELAGKGTNESLHFPDFVGFMGKQEDGRYLHLNSTDNDKFVAKARLGGIVPKPIKNPSYEKLHSLIKDSKPKLDFS